MDITSCVLTVFFEPPFWVGIYERQHKGQYEACKVTFGAEPKDYQVYTYTLKNWNRLRFSPSIETSAVAENKISPKRLKRLIKKQMNNSGIGTKAQQALKLQQEQGKLEHKTNSREQREKEKQRQFQLRQEKQKEKHRGH